MRVHEELLAPSMGLAPNGASVPLFKIVPDDFVEPARNAAMPSAVVFKKASEAQGKWALMASPLIQTRNTVVLARKPKSSRHGCQWLQDQRPSIRNYIL